MKIQNRVKTHNGEFGVIVKKASPPFDWWVDVEFTIDGKDRKMRVPYFEDELEIVVKGG